MAHGTCEHEDMPDHIVIAQTGPEMEGDPDGEKKSANAEQNQCRPVQIADKWFNGHEPSPAGSKIKPDRHLFKLARKSKFEHNADKCKAPHHAEQAPTPGSKNTIERDRSVGSSNKEIYCRVIQQAQQFAEHAKSKYVVERRSGEDEQKSAAINCETSYRQRSRIAAGYDN